MTLRFPQVFTLLMLAMFCASIGLSRGASGRVTDSLQFLFSPLSAPAQWFVGDRAERVAETRVAPAILPAADPTAGEVGRLRDENHALLTLAENLRGQLDTLRARQAEVERVGENLRDLVHSVAVLGVETGGRDVLRLAGTNVPVEVNAAVATDTGIVGRVMSVGAANQSSVRLITDKGFKLVGTFVRARATADGRIEFQDVLKQSTLVEGMGGGAMRIDSLKNDAVVAAGLRVGDLVVLANDPTQPWPIELHGRRVGLVTAVGRERDDARHRRDPRPPRTGPAPPEKLLADPPAADDARALIREARLPSSPPLPRPRPARSGNPSTSTTLGRPLICRRDCRTPACSRRCRKWEVLGSIGNRASPRLVGSADCDTTLSIHRNTLASRSRDEADARSLPLNTALRHECAPFAAHRKWSKHF